MTILLIQIILTLALLSFMIARLGNECTYHELHHVIPYKYLRVIEAFLNIAAVILIFILIWSF